MADLSTLLPDAGVFSENGNIIELPNVISGPLSELLAAAGAQGHPWELAGEDEMRSTFRATVTAWPSSQRHTRRTSAAFAATFVGSLVLATTGLAAATGLPLPTTHLVDQAISQFDHDAGSSATPVIPAIHQPGVTARRHARVVGGRPTVHIVQHTHPVARASCPSGTTAVNDVTCAPSSSAVATTPATGTGPAGTAGATGAAVGTDQAAGTTTGRVGQGTGGGTSRSGTGSGTGRTGSGGSGGGSSRGGNHGTGSGTGHTGSGGSGGGSSRGGNHGTGGGHCEGSPATITTVGAPGGAPTAGVTGTASGAGAARHGTGKCGGSGHGRGHRHGTTSPSPNPSGASGQSALGGNGTGSGT